MGAVFVVPVHCGEVHRDSTDRTATVVGADVVVEEHGTAPRSATSSRPRKTKRMDRRLTHWQCAFCRHEMLLSEGADKCSRCNGTRQHLGDADAEEREKARRQSREKEAHGRKLNARGTGTECVPRAAQGVFEVARHDALVRWETTMPRAVHWSMLYQRSEQGMRVCGRSRRAECVSCFAEHCLKPDSG